MSARMGKDRALRMKIHALMIEGERLALTDPESSGRSFLRASRLSKQSKDKELIATCLLLGVRYFYGRGNFDEAMRLGKRALALFEKAKDTDGMLSAKRECAISLLSKGGTKDALLLLNEVLYERVNSNASGKTVRSLADRVLHREPDLSNSRKHHERALALLYRDLGIAYFRIYAHGIPDKSSKHLRYMTTSLKYWRSVGDRTEIAKTLDNLAGVYMLMNEPTLALRYNKQSLAMNRKLGNEWSVAKNLYNTSLLYFDLRKFAAARTCAHEALEVFLKLGDSQEASRVLKMSASFEWRFGSLAQAERDIAQALRCLDRKLVGRLYFEVYLQKYLVEYKRRPSKPLFSKVLQLYRKASRANLDMQYEIAVQLVRMAKELGLYKQAVRLLEEGNEFEIRNERAKQAMEIDKLEVEAKLKQMDDQRELLKFKTQTLESEVRARTRETELLALQLAKKGSFLTDLTDQLRTMQSAHEQYSQKTLDAVVKLIESARFKDKEYEKLEARATSLYPDFVVSLSDGKLNLTEAERRVCILLRLGLNSVEIANAVFVSVRTVESHFLSIRKKLRIPKSIRLPKYFRSGKALGSQ